jgi:hypothetical protein
MTVGIAALWLPILLSAVIVFAASSVIHMLLGYHNNDYQKVPNEDQARDGLRAAGIPPGDYAMPRADSMKEMSSPEMLKKYDEGPVVVMTVMPNAPMAMGKSLVLWFVYLLVAAVFVAYVAGRTLTGPQEYLTVFRLTSVVAFLTYAGAEAHASIWWGRSWTTTAKNTFDAVIYGLLTGGAFAGFWP